MFKHTNFQKNTDGLHAYFNLLLLTIIMPTCILSCDLLLGTINQRNNPNIFSIVVERYTPEEKRALLKELGMLKVLQPHPNIISLLGCCTSSGMAILIIKP